MLLGMFSIGATYSDIVGQTSEYVPGIGAAPEGRTRMRGGYNGSRSFLCDVCLSFANMIVLLKEKGGMRARAEAYMEENGPVW